MQYILVMRPHHRLQKDRNRHRHLHRRHQQLELEQTCRHIDPVAFESQEIYDE